MMIEDGAIDWGEGGPKAAAEGFDMGAARGRSMSGCGRCAAAFLAGPLPSSGT